MFEIGQEVKIIGNTSGHEFDIGETVRVKALGNGGEVESAECLDGSDYWFLDGEELEPITKMRKLQRSILHHIAYQNHGVNKMYKMLWKRLGISKGYKIVNGKPVKRKSALQRLFDLRKKGGLSR